MSPMDLSKLPLGTPARVTRLMAEAAPYRRKLLSMGVIPGCSIEVVRKAPLGDPIEIAIHGFRLCLRRQEAAVIVVEADA